MSDVDELLAWLTEALDYSRRVAKRAMSAVDETAGDEGAWSRQRYDYGHLEDEHGNVVVYEEGSPTDDQFVHIALHDPRAVLDEVAADRALVEMHSDIHECPGSSRSMNWPPEPCDTLLWRAWAYRNKYAGWRAEWAPEGVEVTA